MTVIIFALAIPMQSFATFEGVKIPVIKSIEVNEKSQSVSMKELDNYYTYIFEQLEKQGMSAETFKEKFPSLYEIAFNFYLSSSNFEYIFDVILASGKKYTINAEEVDIEINKLYSLEVDSYITYETYLAAKANGADEIEIEVNACLYNNLTYDYCDSTGYASECTLPLIDMVVKSITPVSGIPDKIYLDANYIDIDGAEFIVEYADGTVVTDKAFNNIATNADYYASSDKYTLDGNPFFVSSSSDYIFETEGTDAEYYFEYLDATYTYPAVYSETSLFKSVKITGCEFYELPALKSISYELTYEDDRVVSFTKDFKEEEAINLTMGQRINVLDGYIVSVFLTLGDYDITNDTINADYYSVDLHVGNNSDSYKIENPDKDIMNGTLNVIYFFTNIFSKIRDFLYNIFDTVFFAF